MTQAERLSHPVRRSLTAIALAAVAALSAACVTGVEADTSAAPPTTGRTSTTVAAPTTTRRPVTTTAPTTTTPAPTTTVPIPATTIAAPSASTGTPEVAPPVGPEPAVLEAGVAGPRTAALQQQLLAVGYDGGPADGEFGTKTTMAVWAFQKANGLVPDGRVTPELWTAMQAPAPPAPLRPDGGGERVEIDLARQLLFVYDGGRLVLVTHISTGTGEEYCDGGVCGVAVTPVGDFTVTRRISGWRTSALGELYNPLYFHGGIAIHGSPSVPDYPASHGCVRIPMHIAEYFPDLVTNGEPVFVV